MEPPTIESPSIESQLSGVARRIRLRNALHGASVGLAIGCLVMLVLACVRAAGLVTIDVWILPAVVILATVIGGLFCGLMPIAMPTAAAIVDRHYRLKDRAVSGLQFQHNADPITRMQTDDAREHLRQVDPKQCVPIPAHRPSIYSAISLSVLTLAVGWFAAAPPASGIDAVPVALAVDQATELRETLLDELTRVTESVDEPELDELTEKLEELIDQLANESIDERDMMATLSEMEQVIQSARDAMAIEMTDVQMQSLAEAIEPAEAMKAAAGAMKNGDYDSAAEKLEAVDPKDLSDQERRAVADNLKKFTSKLSKGKPGKLSNAAKEMLEGLESENESQCKTGLCDLAKLCKSQGQCKKIGECLSCQLNKLSQCKSQCRGGKNGGNKTSKSDRPKNSWGRGATGNANDGESTRLDSNRTEENLTGVQGDGPSESEIIQAPEGEQSAARAYAAKYQAFRNQAEAVLDSEPLPLGHRETVRQYFENIRPNGASDEAFDDPTID